MRMAPWLDATGRVFAASVVLYALGVGSAGMARGDETANAQPAPQASEGANDVKGEVKETATPFDSAAREATHRIRDAGVGVGEAARRASDAIGDAARESYHQVKTGVRDAWRALKGD